MNNVKEILLSSFTSLDKCVICKGKIENKEEENNLCSECNSKWAFKHKIGDLVEYKGQNWEVLERQVVEFPCEDTFHLNQYFLQLGNERKHVFEGELGEEGLKLKESNCPKCGYTIMYNPECTINLTCLKCGHWYLIDEFKDVLE